MWTEPKLIMKLIWVENDEEGNLKMFIAVHTVKEKKPRS